MTRPGARVLILLLVTLAGSPAIAVDELERRTLKGLQGVEVVVEEFSASAGLSRSTLQTDVELRLRQAGIKVSPAQALDAPAMLYVNVNVQPGRSDPIYFFSVLVEVSQGVALVRDRGITTLGRTWKARGAIVTVGAARFSESVRGEVQDSETR